MPVCEMQGGEERIALTIGHNCGDQLKLKRAPLGVGRCLGVQAAVVVGCRYCGLGAGRMRRELTRVLGTMGATKPEEQAVLTPPLLLLHCC